MKFTKNKNNNINLEEVSSILKIFFDEYKLNKNVNLKNVIINYFILKFIIQNIKN